MFTGIVQHLGSVISLDRNSFGASLRLDSRAWAHHPSTGDSIAVNGCCLTVAQQPAAGVLQFDLIRQTLSATTLGDLRPGDAVNLEHAVTPGSLMGGHIVQGHVDGVGEVVQATKDSTQHRLRLAPPHALMQSIVERGSIAVNGVSLTIAAAGNEWFEVALIPTTLQLTNLGSLKVGGRVNLETDYIAKVVVNWLQRTGPISR